MTTPLTPEDELKLAETVTAGGTRIYCEHGQLKRQCPLCERDEEIDRLRAENQDLMHDNGRMVETNALLCTENQRLRQVLKAIIEYRLLL